MAKAEVLTNSGCFEQESYQPLHKKFLSGNFENNKPETLDELEAIAGEDRKACPDPRSLDYHIGHPTDGQLAETVATSHQELLKPEIVKISKDTEIQESDLRVENPLILPNGKTITRIQYKWSTDTNRPSILHVINPETKRTEWRVAQNDPSVKGVSDSTVVKFMSLDRYASMGIKPFRNDNEVNSLAEMDAKLGGPFGGDDGLAEFRFDVDSRGRGVLYVGSDRAGYLLKRRKSTGEWLRPVDSSAGIRDRKSVKKWEVADDSYINSLKLRIGDIKENVLMERPYWDETDIKRFVNMDNRKVYLRKVVCENVQWFYQGSLSKPDSKVDWLPVSPSGNLILERQYMPKKK